MSPAADLVLCVPPPHSSVSKRSQQLESGWREQGAGVLYATIHRRGDDASGPSQILPTRYYMPVRTFDSMVRLNDGSCRIRICHSECAGQF